MGAGAAEGRGRVDWAPRWKGENSREGVSSGMETRGVCGLAVLPAAQGSSQPPAGPPSPGQVLPAPGQGGLWLEGR